MKNIFLLTILLLIASIIQGQPCHNLPQYYNSYHEALTKVKDATFKIEEKVDCYKSSWILKASFHSCDGKTGYLILTTKEGKEFIHQNLPKSVWNLFKHADSFGSFYTKDIKGRYQLKIYTYN